MWDRIFDAIKSIVTLTTRVEGNEKEIDRLKEEVKRLSAIVQLLVGELKNVTNKQKHDREFIEVFIEKEILKFERRLPAAKEVKGDDEK